MNRRGFDVVYMDSAKFGEFMKADNEDNGAAPKSLGWRLSHAQYQGLDASSK
jgi:hypothetical protein